MAGLAAEKLKAARLLLDQQLTESALEMLLAALLAKAADRAGLNTPINPREAGVWVFSEAVPMGILNQDEAGLIMRGVGLAQSRAAPEGLITDLIGDAEGFVWGSVGY